MGWSTVGISVPGAAHVADGNDGQDAFCCSLIPAVTGEGVVMALADGLGSRAFSGAAARLAAHAAIHALRAAAPLPTDIASLQKYARDAVRAAHDAVDFLASMGTDGAPGCTLLLALVLDDALVCAAVGDGAIVHVTQDDRLLMPYGPDPAAAGLADQVTPLSAGGPRCEPLVLGIANASVRAVGLSSDGLANVSVVATEAGPVIAPQSALDTLVRHVAGGGSARSIRDYVATDGLLRSRTADDLSLVVAAR